MAAPHEVRSVGAVLSQTNATAGANGDDQPNRWYRGVKLHITITSITGTSPTVTVTIQGKTAAGNYYTILASAALNATGTTVLTVYPSIAAAANSKADDHLPTIWRVITTTGGAITDLDLTVEAIMLP